MAYNDFKEYQIIKDLVPGPSGSASKYTWHGGGNGGASQLHSQLSNPLTSSAGGSLRCRKLGFYGNAALPNSNGNNYALAGTHQLLINTSSFDGAFNLIPPNTKAVSIRSWVRIERTSKVYAPANQIQPGENGNNAVSAGIIIKGSTGMHVYNGQDNQNPTWMHWELFAGYRLTLMKMRSSDDSTSVNVIPQVGPDSDSNLRLQLTAHNKNLYSYYAQNAQPRSGPMNSIQLNSCAGTYQTDTWYHLRLDVIPIASDQDLLIAYTGNGAANETWTEVARLTVRTSDTRAYCSWANSDYNGYGVYMCGGDTTGQSIWETNSVAYFDKIEGYVEDI